jgi:hypothetical protein
LCKEGKLCPAGECKTGPTNGTKKEPLSLPFNVLPLTLIPSQVPG